MASQLDAEPTTFSVEGIDRNAGWMYDTPRSMVWRTRLRAERLVTGLKVVIDILERCH